MKIISHRGYWKTAEEKNKKAAFYRAFSSGFGVETDLRDFGEKIVISHDSPSPFSWTFEEFLEFYQCFSCNSTLALNIKADGLQERVRTALTERAVTNYFIFDMSVPDALEYKNKSLKYFTRQSELEPQPALYDSATGVWMDSFYEDWINEDDILFHMNAGKEICVCSPELHHRDPANFWARLLRMESIFDSRIMLCTDEPQKARDYFKIEGCNG